MKNKVLISGGLGFIGSHLATELSKKYGVIIYDNFTTNKVVGIPNTITIAGDILNTKLLDQVINNVKYIFHLGAISTVPYSISHLGETNAINIQGTINLLQIAKAKGVDKVIFASSSSIYDCASPYAISKLIGEKYCSYLLPDNSISLRLFNVYGPRQGNNVIKCFSDKVKENKNLELFGATIRDYIYINDIIKAFIHFAESKYTNKSIDIGTGIPTNVNTLARMFTKNIKYEPKRAGDNDYACARSSLASSLGFTAQILLQEGLNKI